MGRYAEFHTTEYNCALIPLGTRISELVGMPLTMSGLQEAMLHRCPLAAEGSGQPVLFLYLFCFFILPFCCLPGRLRFVR